MLHIIGYIANGEIFKLYNSEDESTRYITNTDVSDLIKTFEGLPEEHQRLRREVRHLKRLLKRQADGTGVIAHHVMYYSCDYDENNYVAYNIKAHLFNGEVLSVKQLKHKKLNIAEEAQLSKFSDVDYLKLNMYNYYLMNSGTYFTRDIGKSCTADLHVFSLLVNGTGKILSIAFVDSDNGTTPLLALPGADYTLKDLNYSVYPMYWEDDGYKVMHVKHTTGYDHYIGMKWTEYILASKSLHSLDSFNPEPVRDYDYKLKAFDSYNYLVKSGLAKAGLVQLFNTVIDYSHIGELRQRMQSMSENISMYGEDTVLKVVVDETLEAIIADESRQVVVDIAGIKVIRGEVFSGYSAITLVCNGEFVLEVFTARSADNSLTPLHINYLDKELKNKVNQIQSLTSFSIKVGS